MVHSITRIVIVGPSQNSKKIIILSINNSIGAITIVTIVIRTKTPDGVVYTVK